jgi:RNA polymerase sigma-70 factor, ECF subfamily
LDAGNHKSVAALRTQRKGVHNSLVILSAVEEAALSVPKGILPQPICSTPAMRPGPIFLQPLPTTPPYIQENALCGDNLLTLWRTLEALLDAHQSMVFSIALRITNNRELAEEVARDVFLELHRNLNGGKADGIQTENHARFWLRKVAVHRAIDAARHRARIPETSCDISDLPGATRDADPLLSERLRRLVAGLPEKMNAAIVLRYQEDLMPEEIAEALGMPVATVKSNLHRGLEILRQKTERVLR